MKCPRCHGVIRMSNRKFNVCLSCSFDWGDSGRWIVMYLVMDGDNVRAVDIPRGCLPIFWEVENF